MGNVPFDPLGEPQFIEEYYNRQRLHCARGYRPPEEFEQRAEVPGQAESRSATMQFFENEENSKNGAGFSKLMLVKDVEELASELQMTPVVYSELPEPGKEEPGDGGSAELNGRAAPASCGGRWPAVWEWIFATGRSFYL